MHALLKKKKLLDWNYSNSSNFKDKEFIQYLNPVDCGPSLKTWPKCESQEAHMTSVLVIP